MGAFVFVPARRINLILEAVALASLLATAVPVRAATQLGNIMPLGDSITQGVGALGGYREPLYNLLTNGNYAFTFVGSATDYYTSTLTAAGQTHHEGHSGATIQNRDPSDPTQSGTFLGGGILESLPGWIGPGGANPNYILLTIGTNDIANDYYVANAPNRLSNLISAISNRATGLRPNAHLIVAEIPPTGVPVKNAPFKAFDDALPGIIAGHQSAGENVSLVDLYTPLDPNTDFADGYLHPNIMGDQKIAAAFYNGITSQTLAPEPVSLVWIGVGIPLLLMRRRSQRS